MTSVRTALEERRSCAVAATNSPVVLQGVPGRYVHVLTRYGSRTSVRGPTIETYGESTGLITSHVLGMDITQSNCAETLKELASRMSMEEIDALFGTGMSAQARALVMQMQHRYERPQAGTPPQGKTPSPGLRKCRERDQ